MSKVSKDFKQIINEEKPIVNQRKRGIGFVDEDFIDEYLEEEQLNNNGNEEEKDNQTEASE